MATEPKPKAVKKKKRRRAPPEAFVQYIVVINGWDWSYALLLNDDKQPVDPYHEFRHLQITGKLLRPAGLKTDRSRCRCCRLRTTALRQERPVAPAPIPVMHTRRDTCSAFIALTSARVAVERSVTSRKRLAGIPSALTTAS
jgi:hypothetical protein